VDKTRAKAAIGAAYALALALNKLVSLFTTFPLSK
jgi:hypothetical protein